MMNYALEGYKLTNRIGSVIAPNWAAKKASIKFLSPNRYAIKAWEQEAEQAGTRERKVCLPLYPGRRTEENRPGGENPRSF